MCNLYSISTNQAAIIALFRVVNAVGGQHADAACDQRQNSKLLRDQLRGQARGVLDDDDPNAVALDPVEQTGETFPAFDRVSTAHRNVGELVHQLESGSLREGRDCRALWRSWLSPSALVAELVRR